MVPYSFFLKYFSCDRRPLQLIGAVTVRNYFHQAQCLPEFAWSTIKVTATKVSRRIAALVIAMFLRC